MKLTVSSMHFQRLNEYIRISGDTDVELDDVNGQRYIGCASAGRNFCITGTPGNALGAYLNGSAIEVYGNAQDAVGDTMNDGEIRIHGNAGDATGYAMRGGRIFIEGDTGYRAGIHMKAYREKRPALVVGGRAGSFLGEYMAGGAIIVLGTGGGEPVAGRFCGTGMHGGHILIRCEKPPLSLPEQVSVERCTEKAFAGFLPLIDAWRAAFGRTDTFAPEEFWLLTPNTKNPYRKLYTPNGG